MAAKKPVKKLVKKPAPAKKAFKKPVAKLVRKKPAFKKPAPKAAPKKKPAFNAAKSPVAMARASINKLAAGKVKIPIVRKIAGPSSKAKPAFKKPAVAAAPKIGKSVPKKDAADAPAGEYRSMRKYTVPKLRPLLTDEMTKVIRAKIKSTLGPGNLLSAKELVDYLAALEADVPDWRTKRAPAPDGKPRKRGRKSKAELEAMKAAIKPVANAAATLAKAASGGFLKPRVAPVAATAPKLANASAVAPKFAIPKLGKLPLRA